MHKRIVEMIRHLASSRSEMSLQSLADQFDVSQRTVRNDLKEINGFLAEHGLSELQLKSGGRIEKGNDFEEALAHLDTQDYYSYKLSREERVQIASAMLVNSARFLTLGTIADNLFVSRATIIGDLDRIKEVIREHGMEVTSHPNKGLLVEGEETQKRGYLMEVLEQSTLKDDPGILGNTGITLQEGDSITLRKILGEQCKQHRLYLSDVSFSRMLRYLGVMIARNQQGEYVSAQEAHESAHMTFAQDILRNVSQYCNIITTEDEVICLSRELDRCRYDRRTDFKTEDIRIQILTREFIRQISLDLGVDLNDDYDFFENLSNHLQSTLATDASLFREDENLTEVAEGHPEVIEAVQHQLPMLEEYGKRAITHPEFIYIVIHICAALERKKNREIAFHIIVACHAGIGTSQLLLEKLKKNFNFQVVDVIAAYEAEDIDPSRAEFVISTVPLKNCPLDHVVVSPIFTDEDYLRIGNKLDAVRAGRNLPDRFEERAISAKGVLEAIAPVVERSLPAAEAESLLKELRPAVRRYFREKQEADDESTAPYLHQLLTAVHLQTDVEAADWKEAIRMAAEPLLKEGYVEAGYVDAMIRNTEENGPYYVLSKGFALPHEGLEAGSVRVGMNLIRLKTPVPFDAEELDPIEFVCVLSAVDHKTHLKALFNLVNLLSTPGFKEDLHKAESPEELYEVIHRYELSIEDR